MSPAICTRRLDALFDRRSFALPLFAVIAAAFTGPLYLRPWHLGHGDWIWFHFIWESARKSYVDFGAIPWWNPYYCGGNLGVANPQGFGLSPLFLLLLPLPTALAMKVYLTTLTFLGQWGLYELARRHFARGQWAAVAAVLFSCSGYMGWHMNGQTGMANLHLLPWVVYFYLRGWRRPAWALGAGAVLAFMLLTSGLYPCVISCITLAVHGGLVLLEGRWTATFQAIRSGAIAAVSTPIYAAIKLIPVIDFLADHRRPIPKDDAIGLPILVDALFVRRTTETQIWGHEGYMYAWWGEYGNYLGPAGVLLGLVGLWHGRARRRRELWLLLVFLGLVIGDHGSYSPYAILRSLPMLGNLRVPTRYWIVVDLWLALLVAAGGARLARGLARRARGAVWAWGLFGALQGLLLWFAVDLIRTNGVAVFRGAMPTPPAPLPVPGARFRQVLGSSFEMYRFAPRNQGSLRCFDELVVEISPALRPDLPSEAYLQEPDAGTVSIRQWSPSDWLLDVDLSRPTTVILNQNAYRGWRTDAGELTPHEGLVAVRVPQGKRTVRVWYRPRGYQIGVGLTLLGLAGTAILIARGRRQRVDGGEAPRPSAG